MNENETKDVQKESKNNQGLKKGLAAGMILLLALALGYYSIQKPQSSEEPKQETLGYTFEDDPNDGMLEGMSREEIQEELNRRVEEGMVQIKLNSSPTIYKDQILNLDFENVPENGKKGLQITITIDGEEEPIYESGVVPSNKHIKEATLNRELPVGEYPAIGTVTTVDTETMQAKGKTNFEMKLYSVNE